MMFTWNCVNACGPNEATVEFHYTSKGECVRNTFVVRAEEITNG